MLTLSSKIRKDIGKKSKILRKKGILPAILYGPKTKPIPLEINLKEFKKIYKTAGESSLISLEIGKSPHQKFGGGDKENFLVLIHEIKESPLTGELTHIDFYHPILTEEVQVTVPLFFEGVSLAVKDLKGTLVKEAQELEIRALPQNLPHDIKVNIEGLKTFEDEILIKDLIIPEGVKVLKAPDEIVAVVVPPEKVEEELEKPIEEKIEEVEKVEEKKEKEEVEEKEKIEEQKQEPKKEKV